MSLMAILPSPTLSTLGQLRALPLEVRQEIYHYHILLSQHTLDQNYDNPLWPRPELLNNNSYILASMLGGGCPHYHVKKTNLLRVNSTIYREIEEVLHTRFIYLFQNVLPLRLTCSLNKHLHACAMAQISRLSFVTSPCKAPGLNHRERQDMLEWKENFAMLVQCCSNLRTVCFEIRGPCGIVSPPLHKPMMWKCLAIARPFKDVRDLRISWVGENLGAHIAQLCEGVTGCGGDWPWSGYDESLCLLREEINAGHTPNPFAVVA